LTTQKGSTLCFYASRILGWQSNEHSRTGLGVPEPM